MEKNGQIEIRVSGKIGNVDINPDNFDIREIISILENVDDLLYNGDKKNRPLISYDIQEGSVRNIFKTGIFFAHGVNAGLWLESVRSFTPPYRTTFNATPSYRCRSR